jgi:thiol:disulfide interchange protein DsbC
VRFRGEDGVRILYTDAAASHIIVGKIYDAKTDRDLTETRMRRLNAINMSSLPLNQAVKVQRGNGKRMLVMFSDPYCPYCRTFEAALQQINDVTIYVFMIPLIKPDLADHSRAVWCSKDRAKAWIDLALHGKPPAGTSSCDNPVDKNLELGQKLGVNSTPTVYLANGERFAGAIQAAELRKLLDEVASSK